ncbi:MAG TPA: hypothetical protein VMT11_10785 [Myxococcaceae bacterium]|nr:hypothetical protein [Myxococcaceae bacterium]
MMLGVAFPMLPSRARWALLALGTSGLAGCGPGVVYESGPAAVATARALVRPHVARNAALSTQVARDGAGAAVTPGPTAVVLGHVAPDGSLRVGCVDSEDGAEALVRDSEGER